MKRALTIMMAATLVSMAGAQVFQVEKFTSAPAVELPEALDGRAVVIEDGETLELKLELAAATWRVTVTVMGLGDEPVFVTSLLAGEVEGRHFVAAGEWTEIGLGVEQAVGADTVTLTLTADGSAVA
ncbi:MAG: hypothetical protein J7M38_07715, partial [Armatimonadetes bacterium]|nr:hypothetical protein [Armatimonadota bacterium]